MCSLWCLHINNYATAKAVHLSHFGDFGRKISSYLKKGKNVVFHTAKSKKMDKNTKNIHLWPEVSLRTILWSI